MRAAKLQSLKMLPACFLLALSESSVPVCRVCRRPMVCLDEENQRWYCYRDDEVFFAKEQRWQEPRSLPGLAPIPMSRKSRLRLFLANDILASTIVLVVLMERIIQSGVPQPSLVTDFVPFLAYAFCFTAYFCVYWTIPKVERGPQSGWPLWSGVFHRPYDKQLIALFTWWVLTLVGFMVIIVLNI